jgi:hypothetical protein
MSQTSDWKKFVKRRRSELHDAYPCAMPTNRTVCPRHRQRLGPVTRMCLACRDGLYEQLAAEYIQGAGKRKAAA